MEIDLMFHQTGKDVPEVFHVKNIVDGMNSFSRILLGQPDNLRNCALGRLAAKCHARAIQATEGAVMLRTPPAAPRCLDKKSLFKTRFIEESVNLIEIVVIVGERQFVQVLYRTDIRSI